MNKRGKEIYFISDLHIGGDGITNAFEAEQELIEFIEWLNRRSKSTDLELIIAGDFLGLWEVQEKRGLDKFHFITETHRAVFQGLKELSQNISIILIPGNHDHELACFKEYGQLLREWGIELASNYFVEREYFGKKARIEHGNRFDPYNKIERFGDINDTPYGFHLRTDLASKIVRLPEKNHHNKTWLTGFISVPVELIPHWFISNYFYRELTPILRYFVAPLLMLFTLSTVLFVLAVITRLGLIDIPDIFYLTSFLGPVKYFANAVILFNFLFIVWFIIFSIAWKLIRRDLINNLREYGIHLGNGAFRVRDEKHYKRQVKNFLRERLDIDIFIYGDSHYPDVMTFKNKGMQHIIGNTGTWTKSLHPVRSWFRLPSVYYPHFQLAYLVLKKNKSGKVSLSLKFWSKKAVSPLTPLERLSILFKDRDIKPQENTIAF